MAISIASAAPLSGSPNIVRVTFTEAPDVDAGSSIFYEKSNYTFRTRYGIDIPIYAKEIVRISGTIANIVLQEAMLTGGAYELTILNVFGTDGVPIQSNTYQVNFTGAGEPLKVFAIKRRVPSWWQTNYGTRVSAILSATGRAIDTLAGTDDDVELNQLQKSFFLRTAEGGDLSVIGQNYGVTRPDFALFDDNLYRQVIPVLATSRKSALKIFYDAVTIMLGDQETIGWGIFSIRPNELEIVIPPDAFFGIAAGSPESATYLHADATEDDSAYPGDYFLDNASVDGATIDGKIIILFRATAIEEFIEKIKAAGIAYTVHNA